MSKLNGYITLLVMGLLSLSLRASEHGNNANHAVAMMTIDGGEPESRGNLADKKPSTAGNSELVVIGVAQDAGYPQAGCYKPHCMPAWLDPSKRRTPTALAILDHQREQQYLFEATPALPEQLYHLYSITQPKQYQIKGVMLTHAHIGHYTGLIHFGHEAMGAKKLPVYTMPKMAKFLTEHGPWSQLVKYKNIALQALTDGKRQVLSPELSVTPLLVPHRDEFSETVGYLIEQSKRILFIPDIDKWHMWSVDLAELIKTVDYAFLDATFYDNDELPNRDMSQVPHPFVVETMALLAELPRTEKAKVHFIHLNHSNPLLNRSSKAYKTVTAAGYNVAEQGMRIPL